MNRGAGIARAIRLAAGAVVLLGVPAALAVSARRAPERVPATLAETGLFADAAAREVRDGVLAYTPQYPLWSDGAAKRRWIRIPRGESIDASDPDAWDFPAGTELWKEFSFGGRRVETRYMRRAANGAWLFATYAWNDDQGGAELAPEAGIPGACESIEGARHDIPSVADCRACHEGSPSRVLGFSALQLSPDRDPGAPHAEPLRPGDVDLRDLAARGLVRGLPRELVEVPPRVAAASELERAARGYLHGNCSNCHNARGPLASLDFDLAVEFASRRAGIATAIDAPSRLRAPGSPGSLRIASGDPDASLLVERMRSRSPLLRMPAVGTHVVDADALATITAWIREDLRPAHGSARDLHNPVVTSNHKEGKP